MTVAFVSKTVADDVAAWFAGTTFPAAPAALYVALVTTAPTDRTGTGLVECTGGSYARQALTLGTTSTSGSGTSALEEKDNGSQLSFTNMPSCTVVGIALYDASTAGTFLAYADLTGGSQVVAAGATFNLPASNVVLSA